MRCGSFNKPPKDSPILIGQGDDEWQQQPNGDRTCSFCGSLHVEDAIKHLKHYIQTDGNEGNFSTTDKNYKVYINGPNVKNASEGGIKFYSWHGNKEELEELNRLIQHAHTIMLKRMGV